MFPIHLALVSEVDGHDPGDVARVAAAVQKQLIRDFAPIWGRLATIDAFPSLDDVPVDYWPIVVGEHFTFQGLGIHRAKDGQPFALIKYTDSWSLTVSHEALEAIVDADGNRLIAGPSVKPGQGRVQYLVEVCDPCEKADFGYTVNDILVSDFYTPQYFDPYLAPGVRYSFKGNITQPREVLDGGYLSWHDPVTDEWWQLRRFNGPEQFVPLGRQDSSRGTIRELVDHVTPHPELDEGVADADEILRAAVAVGRTGRESTGARARELRAYIDALQT